MMNGVVLFATLQLESTGVRFVAAYAATARWGLLRGFLRDARRAVLAASVACGAAGALAVLAGRDWLVARHPLLPETVWLACVLLPVTALLVLNAALLQGLQRFAAAQFGPNVLRPLLVGILVGAAWLVARTSLPAWGPVAANVAASVVALSFVWTVAARATPPEVRGAAPAYDRGDWVRTTRPILIVSVAQLIISQQADLIVVGTIISARDTGTYAAVSQLTAPLSIIVNAITFVAQAMIADLYARGNQPGLQGLIRAVCRANMAIAVPVVLVLVLFGRPLLSLYGPGFVAGYPVLVVLAMSQLVIALAGSLAGYLLTMTRHQTEAAWIIGASAVVNLVLTLVLTPRFGLIGTASATLTAATVRTIALSWFIRRTMRLTVPAF
jgi:O-antigen/teichoic acid export membrane protein